MPKASSTISCKFYAEGNDLCMCVLNRCIWNSLDEKSSSFLKPFNKVIRQKVKHFLYGRCVEWKCSVGALEKKKCMFYYIFMLARNAIKLSETTCCVCTHRIAWPILLLGYMNESTVNEIAMIESIYEFLWANICTMTFCMANICTQFMMMSYWFCIKWVERWK